MPTPYTYGTQNLNDGVNYFLIEKSFDTVPIRQTLFKIARQVGMKKTGEVTNQRSIYVRVRVLGTSRSDLESKLDTLCQALNVRQQQLRLHALDTRYFIADALAQRAPLPAGRILSTTVDIVFTCQQPYALATATSTATTGAIAYPLSSGSTTVWQNSASVTGTGTVYTWSQLTLTNNTAANNTTLSAALTSGTAYTSLSVAALPAAAVNGAVFTLNNGAGHTQNVTLSATALSGATSLTVNSFTANFSYPATTTTIQLVTAITMVTIEQQTDAQTLQVTYNGFSLASGSYLTIICDPTASNGYSVLLNGVGAPLAYVGVFPVLEPTATAWLVQATCLNQPTCTFAFSWQARFLE